ncbi:MAG: DsbA family protein [Alphaproteobacteria bacterium]|nr:DsbA family protein [Alphaproteobacteria bacterium]
MSFVNKNFSDKPSLSKPIAIVVAVLLVIGGFYTFSGKKLSKDKQTQEAAAPTNPVDVMVAGVKATGLDQDEKVKTVGDVEKVMAKWVETNPHMILQAVANMQKKMQEDMVKNAQKNIGEKKGDLFNDKNSGEYAPAGYDVTVVEFFDYSCGYCKKAQATVDQLIKEDKKIRVVYKEFPILGQPSMEMAQVSVAVHLASPESYKKFHDAAMKSSEHGKDGAFKILKSIGLNADKIEAALKDRKAEIDGIIQKNLELGGSIGINGTPGFVIGEEVVPGALDVKSLQEKVAAVRAKK